MIGGRNNEGGGRQNYSLSLGLRPGTNIDMEVGPSFLQSRIPAQYLTSYTDASATPTFGKRYVFGDLAQTQLSMETRLNVTFTPNLSFQMYAQPLLSSGNYRLIRELKAPGTYTFNDFGINTGTVTTNAKGDYTVDPDRSGPASAFVVSNPDFDVRSIRGSAVFRWEWKAGSTLFFVWQQSRSGTYSNTETTTGIGQLDLATDGRELLNIKPENVFIIKATLWFTP